MILGFTGTREGMTVAQNAALPSVIAVLPHHVLHGGEIDGCDKEFHDWLIKQGMYPRNIYVYPGDERQETYWAERQRLEYTNNRKHETLNIFHLYSRQPYLKRNGIIANQCDHLLAIPHEMTEQKRSGTWSTIRYARKANKPITIIFPDGSIKEEK